MKLQYQVCLELAEVNVQGAVEPERCRDGGDDLRDQPVQVGVRRHRQVQVLHAQVVDGLRSNKSMKKLTTLGWWGLHSTEVPYLLLNQQPRV